MKKVLIVTSASERAHFFPQDLEGWMAACDGECREADAEDVAGFERALAEFAPQVLVGSWDMPAIPLDALNSRGGSLEYFCFIPGSAKKQITREHLEAGLILTTWGGWVGPYVAECALLLTLSALRRVAHWGHQLKAHGTWRPRLTQNRSLFGKRVGLHGFGGIAQSLVELMQPFSPVVTADTSVPDDILARFNVQRAASTEDLFAQSDVLIELKPLTPKTLGSVDERLLRLLPEGACFINIGRGPVVDEAALVRVAQERKIEVALDVYAEEPLPQDSPLRDMPNVFLLPHMGGATIDRGIDCGRRALQNVERYLAGKPLENVVDAAAFDRAT
jgi:phosphoglycerate dehydrogenase-like enzyme